ncbi:hypothetical protein DJFAAGMI_01292 [Comamonas sp. PE63]|uniref:Uncharacterized protein n=2 Tax=Comamonas brasiliensis TaxID=1812482 RepID=A0ABS5LPY2_9BURK|nr:hypothetical protein [Comamonas sp. PE63]
MRESSTPPKCNDPALLLPDAIALCQGLLRQLSGRLLTGKSMRFGIGIECSNFSFGEIEWLPGLGWCWHLSSFRVT